MNSDAASAGRLKVSARRSVDLDLGLLLDGQSARVSCRASIEGDDGARTYGAIDDLFDRVGLLNRPDARLGRGEVVIQVREGLPKGSERQRQLKRGLHSTAQRTSVAEKAIVPSSRRRCKVESWSAASRLAVWTRDVEG